LPLSFPTYPIISNADPSFGSEHVSKIARQFASLRKPADVTVDHLSALNISFQSDCGLNTILSDRILQHVPPNPLPVDEVEGSSDPQSRKLLRNGRPRPNLKDYQIRLKELQYDNQDAFAVLSRKPQPGLDMPRLVHFRRFWDGLDNMAYYWDTSLDDYITLPTQGHVDQRETRPIHNLSPESSEANIHEPRKKPKTEDIQSSMPSDGEQSNLAIFTASSVELPTRTVSHPLHVGPQQDAEQPQSPTTGPRKGLYRGNRIGNAAGMPEQYRIDTCRSFVESICWAFGVTLSPHRKQPLLSIHNIRFPVRVSAAVWETPKDRLKARQGWLQGPAMGLQIRPDIDFGGHDPDQIIQLGALDLLRETAGILYLAQERDREGKQEKKPGDGEWWTCIPRWGGGTGGEVGEARGDDDPSVSARKSEDKGDLQEVQEKLKTLRGRERKKVNAAEVWKTLRPGAGIWDPKVEYEAIGKEKGNKWDEVNDFQSPLFLIRTLTHLITGFHALVHQPPSFNTEASRASTVPSLSDRWYRSNGMGQYRRDEAFTSKVQVV
jgi:hypothetical protein